MGIVLTFVVNAGLNFALGLVVAAILGPEAFGRFGVAMTASIVITTLLFEWLRLCATRFYGERIRGEDPGLRAALDLGYAGISLALAALAVAAVLSGADLGLPAALVAGAAAAGFANGLFEYQGALARARFLDGLYARLVVVKNALAFMLMVLGAWWTRDPAWVLAGAAASALAAVATVWRALRDPGALPSLAELGRLKGLAAYALPVIAANAGYQVATLAARGAAAAVDGFSAAGRLSLATDLGLRLVVTVGAALDVWLFQLAVRAEERDGRAAAERQAMRNAVAVTALLCPLAAGYLALMPAFEALLVPAAFRGEFALYSAILVPGLLAFGLVQFALNPFFQLARRTGPALAAAGAALALGATGLLLMPRGLGTAGIAALHAGALVAGFLVALALAARTTKVRPPPRDLLWIAGATALMTGAVWPLRALDPPLLALGAGGLLGAGLYAALILASDVAGLRTPLLAHLRARRA